MLYLQVAIGAWMCWITLGVIVEMGRRRRRGIPLTYGPWLLLGSLLLVYLAFHDAYRLWLQ
jgi:hypothetical protein